MDNTQDNPSQNKDHDKAVMIIVNGREKEFTGKEITYEQVVNLAYDNNPPTGENVMLTVTFSRGENDKQGTMLTGSIEKVKKGMIFNVKPTDRS